MGANMSPPPHKYDPMQVTISKKTFVTPKWESAHSHTQVANMYCKVAQTIVVLIRNVVAFTLVCLEPMVSAVDRAKRALAGETFGGGKSNSTTQKWYWKGWRF
jgi:hypothetical protein